MTTRYRDGSTTITLDDGLDRWARSLLSAAETATVAVLEEEAERVAAEARQAWYGPGGVTKETGLSGDIQVVTLLDANKNEVRVSIGSTDTRKAGKSGKPTVVYVHAPSSNPLKRVQVTHDEYWAAPKSLRSDYHPRKGYTTKNGETVKGDPPGSGPFIYVHDSARASDGQYLLAKFVRKPIKGRLREIAARLPRNIVAASRAGG